MPGDPVIGWDLGGAHLKAALVTRQGVLLHTVQLPCPLWQGLQNLDHALDEALRQFPDAIGRHAVTMTGELVDLFADRADGVRNLLDRFSRTLPAARTSIYAGVAGFVTPERGAAMVEQVASANWLATAELVASKVAQCLLVDVGSTTTDIVPIRKMVLARGQGDQQRLALEELVYTGVVRTPVMAVVSRIPFQGEWLQPMAEHFATMADVYRLTGELPEGADQLPTADHAGKSIADSARRVARLLGCDVQVAALTAWQRTAAFIAGAQQARITEACARVLSREDLERQAPLVAAGAGRFVVQKIARAIGVPCIDFASLIVRGENPADGTSGESDQGDWAATCAPAVAVAMLACTLP